MLIPMNEDSPPPPKRTQRMKMVGFRADPDLFRLMKDLMRNTGLTRSGVIKLALHELADRRLNYRRPDGRA